MRNLSKRIERVEERLGTGEDEMPAEVTFHVRERSFASVTDLKAWHDQHERQRRLDLGAEAESFGGIDFTVVRRCRPGEEPTVRDVGVRVLGGHGGETLASSVVPS